MADNINVLYQPFTADDLTKTDNNLAAEDKPIQTFKNKGNYMISVILVTLAVMISLTIFLGFFYEMGFSKDKISKMTDLTSAGKTEAQATTERTTEANTLQNNLENDLEIASYALGAMGIVVAFWFFSSIWYWRGVALPELTRENIIGRDISYSMKTGKAVDNVSKLLAYHVHPGTDRKTVNAREELGNNFGDNLRGAMQQELLFGNSTVKALYANQKPFVRPRSARVPRVPRVSSGFTNPG